MRYDPTDKVTISLETYRRLESCMNMMEDPKRFFRFNNYAMGGEYFVPVEQSEVIMSLVKERELNQMTITDLQNEIRNSKNRN